MLNNMSSIIRYEMRNKRRQKKTNDRAFKNRKSTC